MLYGEHTRAAIGDDELALLWKNKCNDVNDISHKAKSEINTRDCTLIITSNLHHLMDKEAMI